ncbi:MAG: 50S ribosomal protein L17 [Candidatus Moraniibacteriota bacterium]|jgi:large subunit ribosomal protein L17
MKHCKTGRQFGRVRSQRKALLNSLLSSLIIHGRIETTEAKAKESKSLIDKIITKAKRADGNKMEIVRKLEGELSKEALTKLIQDIKKFDSRDSGYARVIKLSPRKSDSARIAILELVDLSENKGGKKQVKAEKKSEGKPKESKKTKETKETKDVKKSDDKKSSK